MGNIYKFIYSILPYSIFKEKSLLIVYKIIELTHKIILLGYDREREKNKIYL